MPDAPAPILAAGFSITPTAPVEIFSDGPSINPDAPTIIAAYGSDPQPKTQMIVSGSTWASAALEFTASENGKPAYEFPDGSQHFYAHWIITGTPRWIVGNTGNLAYFYSEEDVATPDLVSAWTPYLSAETITVIAGSSIPAAITAAGSSIHPDAPSPIAP
jgi:hypothetical protein